MDINDRNENKSPMEEKGVLIYVNGEPKRIPKFLEGEELPEGYFDPPDPYKPFKSERIKLGELVKYAKEQGKDGWDLTKEEVDRFRY